MHIIQVTPTSYTKDGVIGGGERLALYIDEALQLAARRAGLAVTTSVLSLSGPAAVGDGLDRYQSLAGRQWDPRSFEASALMQRLRFADLVYVHQCMTEVGLFAAAHARLLGKPVFGSDAGAGEAPLVRNDPATMLIYEAVHAISAFAAEGFAGFPVPVHVVPGPVDTELHAPPPPDASPRDRQQVVSVGRVMPHKGIDRTIRALPAGASLTVVGQRYDDAYFEYLLGCAEGKDVRFHDGLDDGEVRALLHRAGLFVHASTHVDYLGHFYHKPELLGLAPLEALASGLPTLVSDAGSLPELGGLPGCHVFRSEAELAALMQDAVDGRMPAPPGDVMHAEVDARYGSSAVGRGLLDMMKVSTTCASFS